MPAGQEKAGQPPAPVQATRRRPLPPSPPSWNRHTDCSLDLTLGVGVALIFQQVDIFFLTAVDGHAHRPGASKHRRVLDRHVVGHVVRGRCACSVRPHVRPRYGDSRPGQTRSGR
uniref:Uncharacterized protein n=1 Tax=uncultured marine microorganism HF4000_009L19 TaxID=455516 RepID=B3T1F0_9ZZZZ|nr:hypothetical protein ALOHA_HF4000009L19ctg1g6 [uncultured marine microorganism HF4000_009L19]